jgi:hypothetical protein
VPNPSYGWYTQPETFEPTYGNDAAFMLNLDVGGLFAGRRYRVCTDLDGALPTQLVGDSGRTVYVSPVTAVSPPRLPQNRSALLSLTCRFGGCPGLSGGFLAPACGESATALRESRRNTDDNQTCAVASVSIASGLSTIETAGGQEVRPATPLAAAEAEQVYSASGADGYFVHLQIDTECVPAGLYRLCLVADISNPQPPPGTVRAPGDNWAVPGVSPPHEDSGFSVEVMLGS